MYTQSSIQGKNGDSEKTDVTFACFTQYIATSIIFHNVAIC